VPRVIEAEGGESIELGELIDALETERFDPRDEDGFAAMGPWLARLGRNRRFLSDLAMAELERRFAGQSAAGYGAQVLLLAPPRARFALRANFWPAREDAVVRAGGTAPFFYDVAHDHNFSFLTYGYLGPGYWSDDYASDGAARLPGERAGLVFEERSRLTPGKLMLYRAHRDVHRQLPPDAFSVSLNVLGTDRAQQWRDQYRFDVERDQVVETLSIAPSEALVTLAVELGGAAGEGLARDLAARHPMPRMRATALAALDDPSAFERACDDVDPAVARMARAWLADRSVSEKPGRAEDAAAS
jgi:hypothetical protein